MEHQISIRQIWKSKLAIGLIPIIVAVVAIPLTVTVVIIGRVGRQQIVATARTMESSNVSTIEDAGKSFQKLGQSALDQSSWNIANICFHANRKASDQSEADQASSLASASRNFANVTQSSFEGAMHQSLSANKEVLNGLGAQMGSLVANSSQYTQRRVGDRVQSAMLEQINNQMSERAGQLSQLFDSYVQTNLNYLGLSAEMLNLYEDNPSGQKAVLDALVRRFPMLSVVSVTNQNGDETVESAANRLVLASDLTNRANTPYFKSGINDETYVGVDNVVGDGTAPNLRIAVPLELYRGKAIGVLSASLSLDDLWDTIRSQRFGKHGFAYITDVRGRPLLAPRHVDGQLLSQSAPIQSVGWKLIVAQPKSDVMQPIQSFQTDISTNTQRSLAQMRADINSASQLATVKLLANAHDLNGAATQRLTVRSSQILQQLQQKTERQFVAEREHMQSAIVSQISDAAVKNNSEMVAAAKAASKNLVVGIPVITSMALERANHRLRFFAAIILAVSCALSCLIGLLLAGVMVKPIILLSQGTRALAMGDLSKRVNERAPAEIGDLAVAFNTMAASLQKSREDLTDAESQLVQSAKLASLGTLSAGVAHELNQPIAIVRGIAQQLKVNTSIDPEVRSDLEIIEGQTSRMMKIVVHLRTFCRTGGYEMVRVDVNQVIRDCFILIEAQLRSHGVAVTLDLCESAPKVLGDPNELEQVFINLITNARDAMNDAPNSMLTIRSYVVGNQVQLEFRDNGPGIPDDVAEHIFDPFFTTKEVGKGTGLGLSISHGLIQKHHGTIVAQNDGGAVFTIAIPATDLQTESESQGADAPMIVRHAA